MGFNVVLIVDLSEDNPIGFSKLDLDDKISIICSLIIGAFLNKNPGNQLSILAARGGLVEQITHFSGNKKHHFQGVRRLIGIKKKNGIDLEICFSLAIRLLRSLGVKGYRQIFFLHKGRICNSFFHNVCADLLKNNIRLLVVSFQAKIFFLELLTRITSGEYFLPILYSKKEIFSFIKEITKEKKLDPKSGLIRLGAIQAKIFPDFYFLTTKKNLYLKNIKLYCPKCKLVLKKPKKERCDVCGIFFSNQYLEKKTDLFFLNFFGFEKMLSKNFSIFSLVYIGTKNWRYDYGKFLRRKQCISRPKKANFEKKVFESKPFQKEVFSSFR
mmetsp:Transcript_33195/g.79121  ORF Transcript_33195/g.79121 Transcript_33195/m.79121 type:complete len:327 (+) Transcript_33195:30-1010(+)